MDWKSITDKLNPYLDKAKEFGKKAVEFTEDKVQQMTPLFLKTTEEYEKFVSGKRTVLIAYDDSNESIANEIRLHSSVWVARAFMDAADLKFVSINEYPELVRHMGVDGVLDMRVRLNGSQTHRIVQIGDVLEWWKSPVYDDGEVKNKEQEKIDTKDTPPDPLLESNQK